MAYRYLDDLSVADVAFRATGSTLEEMFTSAWEATLNVMVEQPAALSGETSRDISVQEQSLDLLLHSFLQELLFYKDAEQLLLRITDCRVEGIEPNRKTFELAATAMGQTIDPEHHRLGTDVKAVTFHNFSLVREKGLWKATVVLDV
jgi:SHS2 domain-containing protein